MTNKRGNTHLAQTRLALGTVQFGLSYGITNSAGQVPEDEVSRLLNCAADAGITTLDTASLYGSSEAVLGRTMHSETRHSPFRVITKTSKVAPNDSAADAVARLEASFTTSLAHLGVSHVAGLMVHESDDLLGPHGDALWAAMARLKTQGKAQKIGASIYSGAQIDALLARYPLDLVQIPTNALDHRLREGGQLTRLKAAGVEVHARSIFLQGLLLQKPEAIAPKFGALRDAIAALHHAFAFGALSPLSGLIAAVLGHNDIDRLVMGVTRISELEEIIAAEQQASEVLARNPDVLNALSGIRIDDERILSPARWGELQ